MLASKTHLQFFSPAVFQREREVRAFACRSIAMQANCNAADISSLLVRARIEKDANNECEAEAWRGMNKCPIVQGRKSCPCVTNPRMPISRLGQE